MKSIKETGLALLAGAYMMVQTGCQTIKSIVPERMQEMPRRFLDVLWGYDVPSLDYIKNYTHNEIKQNPLYINPDLLIANNIYRSLKYYIA